MLNQKRITLNYDATSGASWSYSASSKLFASHESRYSLDAKSAYVLNKKLKGIHIHEISGDSQDFELCSNIYANLVNGALGSNPTPVPPPGPDGGGGGGVAPPTPIPVPPKTKSVFGYYMADTGSAPINFPIENVKVESLTHLIYGFVNVSNNALVAAGANDSSNFGKMNSVLRPRNPNVKFLVALSDTQNSTSLVNFVATGSDATFAAFAASCSMFLQTNNLDGVFVELKWPRNSQEGAKLARLCKALQTQFSSSSKRYMLGVLLPWVSSIPTMASSSVFYPVSDIAAAVDFCALQTFDFVAPNTPYASYRLTGHNSSLTFNTHIDTLRITSVKFTVDSYKGAGMPTAKMVVTVPFFGRAFDGVPTTANFNGRFLFYQNLANGTPGYGSNIVPYKEAKNMIATGKYEEYYDDLSNCSYIYGENASSFTGFSYFMSFENQKSAQQKCNYALNEGMFGVLCFELSGDDASQSLLSAVSRQFA